MNGTGSVIKTKYIVGKHNLRMKYVTEKNQR